MTTPASAALQDLGALILGDHPLDLEKQIVFRGAPDRAVQENDLGPGATKLVDDEHLVRITPGKAVGRMNVDALPMCPAATASRNCSRAGRIRLEPM